MTGSATAEIITRLYFKSAAVRSRSTGPVAGWATTGSLEAAEGKTAIAPSILARVTRSSMAASDPDSLRGHPGTRRRFAVHD
jgi:hypothetical protein